MSELDEWDKKLQETEEDLEDIEFFMSEIESHLMQGIIDRRDMLFLVDLKKFFEEFEKRINSLKKYRERIKKKVRRRDIERIIRKNKKEMRELEEKIKKLGEDDSKEAWVIRHQYLQLGWYTRRLEELINMYLVEDRKIYISPFEKEKEIK